MNTLTFVQKVWNGCNVRRGDGMSYGNYVYQLSRKPGKSGVPRLDSLLLVPRLGMINPNMGNKEGRRSSEILDRCDLHQFGELALTAVQAVVTARVEGAVTNGRMQEITGAHPKDITDVLQALVRDGFLEQQNQRRWASYRLVGDSPQSSPQSLADSPHSADDSPQWPPELLAIAAPARTKAKLPGNKLREVIAELCTDRWLTAKELGALLKRDPENLQVRFLTSMVKRGDLDLRYPEVRNRPDQAYRSRPKAQ